LERVRGVDIIRGQALRKGDMRRKGRIEIGLLIAEHHVSRDTAPHAADMSAFISMM
jgi:hypothetical protein